MAEFDEIEKVVNIVKAYHEDITLLKCTSQYPAPIESINLRTMEAMRRRFNVKVGYSDHTDGFLAPIVATSLGADVIEKHITLDRDCLDGRFSILPIEFMAMYQMIMDVKKSLGEVTYGGVKKYRRVKTKGKWLRV